MTLISYISVFVALATGAFAKHITCSWRPGPLSPHNYGFKKYCTAPAKAVPNTKNLQYHCRSDFNDASLVVADYNVLAPKILEFATPCGRDGWYLNASDQCEKNYFVICVRPTTPDNNDCFYMEADDDCQWPHTFEYGAAPTELEIWYKY